MKYSRVFYYKEYKIICKMLGVNWLCYGKVTRKSKHEAIYADCRGHLQPLFYGEFGVHSQKSSIMRLSRAVMKNGLQKAIVTKIMKALKHNDVWVGSHRFSYMYDMPRLRKGTSLEEKVISAELNGDI